jgi:hypothetical protein
LALQRCGAPAAATADTTDGVEAGAAITTVITEITVGAGVADG